MTTESTNTGHRNTGDCNTGHRNTGDCNTGNWNTGDCNTGNRNTGSRNTGDCNTGSWNTGDCNTGNWNTGSWNTGSWNTGDCNTGFFNTTTPETVRAFNRECSRDDWVQAHEPDWLYKPSPDTWVPEAEMSDQEKVENPTFHTCGGYLRKNDWEKEWQKAYAEAGEADIQAVRDLPNFDADIFKEITGLDLSSAKVSAPREIFIEGARYVLAGEAS